MGGIDGIDDSSFSRFAAPGWNSDIQSRSTSRRRAGAPLPGGRQHGDAGSAAPTISGDWLLFGRGAVVRDSVQQVLLQNLVSREKIALDALRSKGGALQAGQVNGTFAVW